MLSRKKHFLQYLRQRTIRDFSVEHFFEFGISACDDVANDRQIRRRLHVRRIKRIEKRNPQAFEKCGSRRVHPRNIPASGAIADPPIPITCTCLPSLNLPPPVPKIRAFLRLPRPASPRFPKEPSTWAAACAPLAHQRPAARPAAAECVHKRRAPLATPPQTAHFPEILPTRSLARPQVFQPRSEASARDPPGRV